MRLPAGSGKGFGRYDKWAARMGDIDFRFYLSLLWRRLPYLVLVAVSIAALAGVIARALPPVYRAQARIVAETPQISTELARSTVPINPWQQIQMVEQRITTRDNLVKLAHEQNVYGDKAPLLTDEAMAEDIRKRTTFQQIDMGALGGSQGAAVFSVSFDARDPGLAARMVNAFVTLIVDRSASLRNDRANEAMRFFRGEVANLSDALSRIEVEILAFKTSHQDALPENLEFRRTRQDNQQERLAQLDREEATLRSRRNSLVQFFETTGGIGAATVETPAQQMLADLNRTLATQLIIFAEDSPHITALRNRIAALKKDVDTAGKEKGGTSELDLQLSDIDNRLKSIGEEKSSVQESLRQLNASIAATPANETALAALERRRDNIKSQYETATTRLAEASTGEQIEANAQGGSFSLVEPATPPAMPISPNRKRILIMGLAAGLGCGTALVVLLELLNKTIRRPRELAELLQTQPLEVVPYIWTGKEAGINRGRIALASIAAATIVPIAVSATEYLLPLDHMVVRVMSVLGHPPIM
jgi:polysaccharide chain length determinant protein (PEP-CTERM system associated)